MLWKKFLPPKKKNASVSVGKAFVGILLPGGGKQSSTLANAHTRPRTLMNMKQGHRDRRLSIAGLSSQQKRFHLNYDICKLKNIQSDQIKGLINQEQIDFVMENRLFS